MQKFPKQQVFVCFVVWFCFILMWWLPRCKSGHINIYHMPPNKVSMAWCCQPVLWLPEPSGDCLPHPVWKIPLFSSEIYESSSVPFFFSSALWSHSPLLDCLPNGHWQMMLKIAELASLLQTAIENAAVFRCLKPCDLSYLILHFHTYILHLFQFLFCTSPFVWIEVDECSLMQLTTAGWHIAFME